MKDFKFAHIADCHLGRWTKEPHKTNEIQAFNMAINECLLAEVDFILISGDLFDSTVPNLDVANEVFDILKIAKHEGIKIYMIFGSHDNSRNRQSIAKLLITSGIADYVSNKAMETGQPQFLRDIKTGAKITGIDGLTGGVEVKIYDNMDKEAIENANGFKIFMFHSAINEFLPGNLQMIEGVDLSKFPEKFDYYAGGHIHQVKIAGDETHKNIAFPGPLYGTDYTDFKKTAQGEQKGFYIVTVTDNKPEIEFIEIEVEDFTYDEISLDGLTAQEGKVRLSEFTGTFEEKVVMVKVTGKLSGGSEGELQISEFNKRLRKEGAKDVLVNTRGLIFESESATMKRVEGMNKEDIESLIMEEEQAKFDKEHIGIGNKEIMGKEGIKKGKDLIKALKEEKKHKEKKGDYENRITVDAMAIFKTKT